jgi:hypothetical protein
MSVAYAMLKAYHLPQGVLMTKFYTNATQTAIWNSELDAERLHDALIDAYDPYMDYDEEGCEYCYFVECVCDRDDQGNEDLGMEEGLFGWE